MFSTSWNSIAKLTSHFSHNSYTRFHLSYGIIVLNATRQRSTNPFLTSARQPSTRFTAMHRWV